MGAELALSVVQTILTAIQTIIAVLQCKELRHMRFYWSDYESQLLQLQKTVMVVESVLLDAEAKQGNLTHQVELWIEELKDAVYDADDLLDEFATFVEQKHNKLLEGANVYEKVRLFFLIRFQDLSFALKMTNKVKAVREKLSTIASNHNQFGFKFDSEPIWNRREETCSYVYEQHIIGRDDDKDRVISMLLDSNDRRHVSFLSIVGVGGLGKTTLARLVFNDERVTREFGLPLWVCVSDHDQQTLDVSSILVKILESAKGRKVGDLIMDQVKKQVRETLSRNKYLLILDDLWNEKRHQWVDLEGYLKEGQRGSKVIVTTRSRETGRIVGDGSQYELKGLSNEDSWHLFERIAFVQERPGQENTKDLVEIGRKIVKKCANVPLAIRVLGSLLYGQEKATWLSIEQTELAKIEGHEDITSILQFSYYHLESPLKSCFNYCALFPKDYEIEKDMLIRLWIAQGFIVPSDKVPIENVAEKYFLILLRRCFFQQVESGWDKDNSNNYQIHDLMHDVAQKVAIKEISDVNSITNNIHEKIRHIYSLNDIVPNSKLRTCLRFELQNQSLVSALLKNCTSLRALSLTASYNSKIRCLPDEFGKLVHLRYLDLDLGWRTRLTALPQSITKIFNLQTFSLSGCDGLKVLPKHFSNLVKLRVLSLTYCSGLEELPKDLSKLVELRVLDLRACSRLEELPKDLDKLVELRVLDVRACSSLKELPEDLGKLAELIVQNLRSLSHKPLNLNVLSYPYTSLELEKNTSSRQCVVDQLGDLKALSKLQGGLKIEIEIPKNRAYVKENENQGKYLRGHQHLHKIELFFRKGREVLLEDLEPHRNLGVFSVYTYRHMRGLDMAAPLSNEEAILMALELHPSSNIIHPGYIMPLSYEEALLEDLEPHPNLSVFSINGYCGKRMPKWMGTSLLERRTNLRALDLVNLPNVEYIVDATSSVVLPSIEHLSLKRMPKLKKWWRSGMSEGVGDCNRSLPLFPRLSKLEIYKCHELTCMPFCPNVEVLNLRGFNERLQIMSTKTDEEEVMTTTDNAASSDFQTPKLNKVEIDNVTWLKWAMPTEAVQCLEEMSILSNRKVRSLRAVGDQVFRGCSSSLRTLQFQQCFRLRSLSGGGLEHLTALETLILADNRNLSLGNSTEDEEEDDNLTWQSLRQSLRHLELKHLPKVVNLPEEMQFLTSLQTLKLYYLDALESLPDWMPKLTSLQTLEIAYCKALKSLPECLSELTSLKQLTLCDCSKALEERCKRPDGEDWPHIQHIPHVSSIWH